MAGTLQVPEAEARQLIVDIGKKAAADPVTYPNTKLAQWFNNPEKRAIFAGRLDRLQKGSESMTLAKNISDAIHEGETVVIVPTVQAPREVVEDLDDDLNDETSLEKTNNEEKDMPAVLDAPRKKKKVERNGQAPTSGMVVQHRQPEITRIDKPSLRKINYSLAKRIRDLERYPNDRPLAPKRCDYLRQAIRSGLFHGSTWVSAHCRENDVTYRLNGKHTSHVFCELYEAKEEVPEEIYQTVHEFECGTLEDVAHLFATFDCRDSARNKNDIIRGFAATQAVTKDLPPAILRLATQGLAFAAWEGNAKRQTPTEQSLLLIQNEAFVHWLREMFGGKKKGQEHIRRMPVVAAMFRTWKKDSKQATVFWTMLRDDSNEPVKSPVRKIYRLLLSKKIGAVKHAAESISAREAYLRCLLAWNAWRGEEEAVFREDMETPVVV